MAFKLGYKPDPDGHRATPARMAHPSTRVGAALRTLTPPPPEWHLQHHAPDNFDQGESSACTGHATSGAATTTLATAGTPLAKPPSPDQFYKGARALDRLPGPDGKLPPLTDDGAEPNQVMRWADEWGSKPMGGPTSDGRNSDVELAHVNDEPSFTDLEADRGFEFTGQYKLDSVGPQRVEDLKKLLYAGIAVCFAYGVGDAFQAWKGGTPLGAATDAPNHYLYAVGYHTDANGKTIVEFRNSWGKTLWGIEGDGEGDEDFIASMTDLWVMDVKLKAAA